MERLLKVPEVAERMAVSRTTVYELMMSGSLRSVKIGKSRRVPETALDAWIQGHGAPPVSRVGRLTNDAAS
jgi:excisionase family DNA binding protein